FYEYADAFAAFYNSGLLGHLNPNYDKIVLVGHSGGSIAVTLATGYFNPPYKIPFAGLILIDPPLYTPEVTDLKTEAPPSI
ncbi:hypothetical protein H0H92_015497, partial [Tricholoma furcatifolium]